MVLCGCHAQIKKDQDARDYQPCLGFIDERKCMAGWRADRATSKPMCAKCQQGTKMLQGHRKFVKDRRGSCRIYTCELKLHDVTFIPQDTVTFLQRAGKVPMDVRDCSSYPVEIRGIIAEWIRRRSA